MLSNYLFVRGSNTGLQVLQAAVFWLLALKFYCCKLNTWGNIICYSLWSNSTSENNRQLLNTIVSWSRAEWSPIKSKRTKKNAFCKLFLVIKGPHFSWILILSSQRKQAVAVTRNIRGIVVLGEQWKEKLARLGVSLFWSHLCNCFLSCFLLVTYQIPP